MYIANHLNGSSITGSGMSGARHTLCFENFWHTIQALQNLATSTYREANKIVAVYIWLSFPCPGVLLMVCHVLS